MYPPTQPECSVEFSIEFALCKRYFINVEQ